MKTNAIIRIVVWSLVILILLGILGGALALRSLDFTRVFGQEEAPNMEGAFRSLPNEETLCFPAGSVRDIEIEWVVGDIVILPADVENIEVTESDVRDENYTLIWNQRGEKLEIRYSENVKISLIGINDNTFPSKDLYIRVPRDWECGTLEVDAASANLEARDLTIREMDFDGASGTCDFVNCSITALDIDTASGDVTFSGTLGSLDFDAASASFIGEFQNTPDRIDMDSMSGNLDIALPEDCGFSVSMDGMSKSLRSDFYGTENRSGVHIYGDGRCRIQVDGMSCDVTIRKLETIINP